MFRVVVIYVLLGAGLLVLPDPGAGASKQVDATAPAAFCPADPLPDPPEEPSISNRMSRA